MLRTYSAAIAAFAVILTGVCACSSTQSSLGSPEASGDVSLGGRSDGGTSDGGTSDGGTSNGGGLSSAGTTGGGGLSSMGGRAAGGEDAAAGGASDSSATGTRSIFFLDVQGNVLTFDEDTPTPRTLVSWAGTGPDGIAVDSAGGQIFWTTMGVPADDDGSLRRANLDGSNVTTIVPTADTYTPKQLKLDVDGKKLYWSDREGMRVQRAAFDGSELETLVTVATGDAA